MVSIPENRTTSDEVEISDLTRRTTSRRIQKPGDDVPGRR